MRTVIQSVALYPHLIGFTMNILQRLIVKQVPVGGALSSNLLRGTQLTYVQRY
jgi:hypothetical protein